MGNSNNGDFKSYSDQDYKLQKHKQQQPQQKTPRHESSTQETAGYNSEEIEPEVLFAIVLSKAECYVESMKQLQTESINTKVKMSKLNNLLYNMQGHISNFIQPSSRPPSAQRHIESARDIPPPRANVPVKKEEDEKQKKYKEKIKDLEKQMAIDKQKHQEQLSDKTRSYREKIIKLEKEKQELLLRLSKFASEKLVDNNPAITDLSDANRPTKLAETYSELYDDEWTDAYEALHNTGYTELETIDILRETLLNAVSFCERNSEVFITHTKELVHSFFARNKIQAGFEEPSIPPMQKYMTLDIRQGKAMQREISSVEVSFSQLYSKWKPKDGKVDRQKMGKTSIKGPSNIDDKMVKVRKDIAIYLLPMVQKAYFRQSWDNDCIPELKPYIKKCLNVGWMMAVQSPPLSLVNSDIKTMDPYFNPEQYKVYTKSGKMIEYVVWPTMLLHEKGPVLCKGTAQGFNLGK